MWWFGLFTYLCHFPKSERVPSGGKPSWVVVEYNSPKWNCGLGGGRLGWLRRLLLGGSGVSVWMSSPWHRNCSRLSVIAKLAVVGLDLVLHPNNYGGSRFPYKSYKELMWHDWGVAVRDSSRLISFIRALQNSIISYKVALVWACGQVQSLGCMTLFWEPLDQFLLAPGTGTLGSWGQGLSSWEGVEFWHHQSRIPVTNFCEGCHLSSHSGCCVTIMAILQCPYLEPLRNCSDTMEAKPVTWLPVCHGEHVDGIRREMQSQCSQNIFYDDSWWWWWWFMMIHYDSWWLWLWWLIMMMMILNDDDNDDDDDDDDGDVDLWWWW
jgi:hypothetical protein